MNRQIYKFTFINKRGLIDKIVYYEHVTLDDVKRHKEDLLLYEPGKYLAINTDKSSNNNIVFY